MPLNSSLFDSAQPTLANGRLLLRPVSVDDAPRIQLLLADDAVSRGTLTIPHPYPDGAAATWIAGHAEAWRAGKMVAWAITRSGESELVGVISLRISRAHERAEAGYWVAHEAWGQGIATEALKMLIAWGFDTLGLHRIEAHHFAENPASGQVMRKAGMLHEGRVRGAVFRDNVPRDLELYGILRSDPRPH